MLARGVGPLPAAADTTEESEDEEDDYYLPSNMITTTSMTSKSMTTSNKMSKSIIKNTATGGKINNIGTSSSASAEEFVEQTEGEEGGKWVTSILRCWVLPCHCFFSIVFLFLFL